MVTELAFISLIVSVLFTAGGARRLGELPGSVSTSVFTMPRRKRYVWTAMLWLSTYTLTPALFQVVPGNHVYAAHAFATSVLLAGLFPIFKRSISRGFMTLVSSAWCFSQVCVALLCPWLLLMWPVVAIVLFVLYMMEDDLPAALRGKGVFLAESMCYVTLFMSIIIEIL